MAKGRVCTGCEHNNNGWCNKRKTNKGLKDLIDCEFKSSDKLEKLKIYIEQKKFELDVENTAHNRGVIKGLEIALKLIGE